MRKTYTLTHDRFEGRWIPDALNVEAEVASGNSTVCSAGLFRVFEDFPVPAGRVAITIADKNPRRAGWARAALHNRTSSDGYDDRPWVQIIKPNTIAADHEQLMPEPSRLLIEDFGLTRGEQRNVWLRWEACARPALEATA
jgi:hypothetical protein